MLNSVVAVKGNLDNDSKSWSIFQMKQCETTEKQLTEMTVQSKSSAKLAQHNGGS